MTKVRCGNISLISKAGPLHLSGRFDDAVVQFTAVDKQFPKGDWARRARFGKAVSLARKGEFRAAELIYRAEAPTTSYWCGGNKKSPISLRSLPTNCPSEGRSAAQARLPEADRFLSQGSASPPGERPLRGRSELAGRPTSSTAEINCRRRQNATPGSSRIAPIRSSLSETCPLSPRRKPARRESAGRSPPHLGGLLAATPAANLCGSPRRPTILRLPGAFQIRKAMKSYARRRCA